MKVAQRTWTSTQGWKPQLEHNPQGTVQLVLAFGSPEVVKASEILDQVRAANPGAHLLGCSTSGEIAGSSVSDESLVITEVTLTEGGFCCASVELSKFADSRAAGEALARKLPTSIPGRKPGESERLVHAFVLSDGLHVNGSALVQGLAEGLPPQVTVSGGLAGDGPRFAETWVFLDSVPAQGMVAVAGLYGNRLKVGCASLGGWDPFGPERLITRSKGNVLYELDGQSVLGLYKQYLGDHAEELPASGLLFPLSLRDPKSSIAVVRTILAIDEKEQSMTFAGDVPEGDFARLMKANFDRLIDGAVGAAGRSLMGIGALKPDLAILISCVGRKLVLRQRVEDEVEGAREVLGETPVLVGFYSYGEISPFTSGAKCELHNQTMTITVIAEER